MAEPAEDAEAVRAQVAQRLRVPDFDGTGHRDARVVGMGAVEFAIEDDAAVEVDERLALFALPAGQAFSSGFVVLGDDVVADGVEVIRVGGDGLGGFRGRDAAKFFDAPTLGRGGGNRLNKQRQAENRAAGHSRIIVASGRRPRC